MGGIWSVDLIFGRACTPNISCLQLFEEVFKSALNSMRLGRPESWTSLCEYHLLPCNMPTKTRDQSLICDVSHCAL